MRTYIDMCMYMQYTYAYNNYFASNEAGLKMTCSPFQIHTYIYTYIQIHIYIQYLLSVNWGGLEDNLFSISNTYIHIYIHTYKYTYTYSTYLASTEAGLKITCSPSPCSNTYIHTYTHTYIHVNIRAHMHTVLT